jgi:TolA-binding protein
MARLRADNQDIPRLRKQIQQLQAEINKLSGQLGITRETAQQQQQQLQEIQAENEQAAADQQAQDEAVQRITAQQRNQCIANLRLIYAAKQAWALEKNKTDTDTPTEEDLLPYIKGGVFPVCPSGGTYTIGPVSQVPTCSIPGHVLPPQ